MNIQTKKVTLTDGSKVYDVIVTDGENKLEFGCTSERMANKFYIELINLIQECTCDAIKGLD
jgi:hypothetical protein